MLSRHKIISSALKLVSLPDLYLRIKTLLDDPQASLADVATLIEQDPSMTVRLLKLANSPFFGCATEISTVQQAVTLLGSQHIHDLVLTASLARTFSKMSSPVMDMKRFWRDSLYSGIAARLLAARCELSDSDWLFVAGLLRDIGHLILFQTEPEAAQQVLLRADKQGEPVFRVERIVLGFDYASIGGELLRAWGLPDGLASAVEFHPEPERAEPYQREAAIVHVAGALTEHMEKTGETEPPPLVVDPSAQSLTGLSEDAIEEVRKQAKQELAEVLELTLS